MRLNRNKVGVLADWLEENIEEILLWTERGNPTLYKLLGETEIRNTYLRLLLLLKNKWKEGKKDKNWVEVQGSKRNLDSIPILVSNNESGLQCFCHLPPNTPVEI